MVSLFIAQLLRPPSLNSKLMRFFMSKLAFAQERFPKQYVVAHM